MLSYSQNPNVKFAEVGFKNPPPRVKVRAWWHRVDGNKLQVTVTNVYRNRMIGDSIQFNKVQSVWTSSPIERFLDKDKPLKPSGLMGPLKLIKVKQQLCDIP